VNPLRCSGGHFFLELMPLLVKPTSLELQDAGLDAWGTWKSTTCQIWKGVAGLLWQFHLDTPRFSPKTFKGHQIHFALHRWLP
jgi:hypothetical protein